MAASMGDGVVGDGVDGSLVGCFVGGFVSSSSMNGVGFSVSITTGRFVGDLVGLPVVVATVGTGVFVTGSSMLVIPSSGG